MLARVPTVVFALPRLALDAMELRKLRRRLPYVYRRLINEKNGVRTETDAEYLARLRSIHQERYCRTRSMEQEGSPG